MTERIILRAEDGMVLTNGTDYGRIIYLAEGVDPATFYQITEAEYEAIEAEQEENDQTAGELAESTDYEATLAKLGVK